MPKILPSCWGVTALDVVTLVRECSSATAKIRYGPFSIPPVSVSNGQKDIIAAVALKAVDGLLDHRDPSRPRASNGTVGNADGGESE